MKLRRHICWLPKWRCIELRKVKNYIDSKGQLLKHMNQKIGPYSIRGRKRYSRVLVLELWWLHIRHGHWLWWWRRMTRLTWPLLQHLRKLWQLSLTHCTILLSGWSWLHKRLTLLWWNSSPELQQYITNLLSICIPINGMWIKITKPRRRNILAMNSLFRNFENQLQADEETRSKKVVLVDMINRNNLNEIDHKSFDYQHLWWYSSNFTMTHTDLKNKKTDKIPIYLLLMNSRTWLNAPNTLESQHNNSLTNRTVSTNNSVHEPCNSITPQPM